MITTNLLFSPLNRFYPKIISVQFQNKLKNYSQFQNKLTNFSRLKDKRFIHSSIILYSNLNSSENINQMIEISLERERLFDLERERLSNLQLIKFNKEVNVEDLSELGIDSSSSSINESFPWLLDDDGKNIDFRKPIGLFNGVKLISNYLEKRFQMDKNIISEVKLTEILDLFEKNSEATVLDLYNHVATLYKNDKESLIDIADKITNDSFKNESLNSSSKPLGNYGDITLNEIILNLKNLNWEFYLNNTKATFHAIPFAVNFIGYSFMLKYFMKYVHNRPYAPNLNSMERQLQQQMRNRQLAFFIIFGTPAILVCLRKSAISLKDLSTVDIPLGISNNSQIDNNNNSNMINSTLFIILSKVNNKIPNWLKLFILFILLLNILFLKLLGFNISDLINNIYYLKIYFYITNSLLIIYQLFNLYLLHKFSNDNIKISNVLPDFLINWLKEFEILSSTKENINEFKKTCYIYLLIYILIIILITLFL